MLAISHQRVDLRIGVAEVEALLIGAGEPLGVDPSGVRLGGFSPLARDAQVVVPVLWPRRQGRRDDKWGNRLGSGAMPQTGKPAA